MAWGVGRDKRTCGLREWVLEMGLGGGAGAWPFLLRPPPPQAMGRLWEEGRFWDLRPLPWLRGTRNFQKTRLHARLLADLSPTQPSLSVQRPRRVSKTSRDFLRPPCVHAQSLSLSDSATPRTSLPGSSVYGISQARIPEWVVISSSRASSRPRDRTRISCSSCFGRWILYH